MGRDTEARLCVPAHFLSLQDHVAVNETFRDLPDEWQFGILSRDGSDHANKPGDDGNDVHHNEGEDGESADNRHFHHVNKDDIEDGDATKEEQGLHGMKAHQAIFVFEEQKEQPGQPEAEIADGGGNVSLQTSGRDVVLLLKRHIWPLLAPIVYWWPIYTFGLLPM